MQHVGDKGARDAQRIDAVMRIEAAILDGDEGVGHVVRQFVSGTAAPPMSPRVASVAPLTPRISTDGGRFGISSDWIGGRWMPIQISAPMPAITAHSASTAPQ